MNNTATYSDVFRPRMRPQALWYDIGLIAAGTLLLAISAQIAVPLPFGPVPLTFQTFAVLLIGAAYGSKRGSLTVIAYLLQGAAGLPVFRGGGAGMAYLAGPTGGYLAGFVIAAALTGWLAERGWDRRISTTLAAMILGNLCIYACGAAWLAGFVGPENVLTAGVLPFLPGDVLKIVLACLLLPGGWRILGAKEPLGPVSAEDRPIE